MLRENLASGGNFWQVEETLARDLAEEIWRGGKIPDGRNSAKLLFRMGRIVGINSQEGTKHRTVINSRGLRGCNYSCGLSLVAVASRNPPKKADRRE